MSVIIIILAIILLIWLLHKFKFPKIGCVSLVSGAVKSGKSTFSLALALKTYKRSKRKIRFSNFFRKIFRLPLYEEPLFYSNIKHPFPYVPVTDDLLLRRKRFRYGSVVYLDEASLVADSMCWKDQDLNDRLMYFNKLFGHETMGGYLIYNTQCINDLHYSIERCISEYFYVHHTISWIPFFLLAFVREVKYNNDGSTMNVFDDDVETTLRPVIIPKRRWKDFDAFCYSAMTDDLPVEDNVITTKDLKVRQPLRFRDIMPDVVGNNNRNKGVKVHEKKDS